MIIFQLRTSHQPRSSIPDNFFDGVPSALIQPATQLIGRFDELNPNARLSFRKEFLTMLYRVIPRREIAYIDDVSYNRTPSSLVIEGAALTISQTLTALNASKVTERNLLTVDWLERHNILFERSTLFEIADLYNSNTNFRNFVDQLIEAGLSSRSALQARDRLLPITTMFGRANSANNSEPRPHELICTYLANIENYTLQNKVEALYRAAEFYGRYGIEGLNYIERFSRNRNVMSPVTFNQWHDLTLFDQSHTTFTADRAENLLVFMQNFRRLADEVRDVKLTDRSLRRSEVGGVNLTEFRPNHQILEGMNYGQVVVEAMRVMDRFGIDHTNRELLFNFVYAVATIGSEKTVELHNRLGIVHFARYTQHTLEEVYQNITNPSRDGRPVAFVYMNRQADWNNAFYQDGPLIDSLTRGYRLIVVEDTTDRRFYQGAIQTAALLGTIGAVGIGGHGKADSIRVGSGSGEENFIDITDMSEMNLLLDRNILRPDAVIFMMACSTANMDHGRPIAQHTSSALSGRRVFAPDQPTHLRNFEFDSQGIITGANYADESSTRLFSNGLLATRPRRSTAVER